MSDPTHGSPDVTLGVTTVGRFTVVAVSGELDLYTIAPLRVELEAQLEGTPQIVVDLSGVTFMDSTGLGVLVAIRRRLPEGATLALAGARPRVAQLFTLTQLTKVFPMYPTVEAATQDAGEL